MKLIAYKIFLGILFLFPTYSSLNAQEQLQKSPTGLALETWLHYGFIARHHPEMNVLTDSHFPVFELSLKKQTFGDRVWQQIYAYPEIGVSYWQCNFGNSEIMGHAYALYPFIRFSLLRKNSFFLKFRFGVGLGYFSNKFDRLENYKNLAIGANINAIINLMFEAGFKIGDKFGVSGGLGLTHFSTGAITVPNYGINIPTINLGVSYNFYHDDVKYEKVKMPTIDRSLEYLIIAAFGVKEVSAVSKQKYFVYTLSGDVLKPMTAKYKLGGGLDLYYDNSKAYSLEKEDISANKFDSNFDLGVHLTYEQTISRLSVLIELGGYVYSKYDINGNIYEKLQLNFLLTSRLLASITLKAHYAKADHVTWGLGYKL